MSSVKELVLGLDLGSSRMYERKNVVFCFQFIVSFIYKSYIKDT